MTNYIKAGLELYLKQSMDGTAVVSEDILDEFAAACRHSLERRFTPHEQDKGDRFLHMSAVGRPLCQQHMQLKDAPATAEDYNFPVKMLLGDLVEASVLALMKGAGVEVQEQFKKVEREVAGETLQGELDVVIDDKVWDIKSCSPYAFSSKFNAPNGFQKIREDDPFGYVAQGFNYGEAANKPFGGWITVNKSTGEIAVCEVPIAHNSYKKEALIQTKANIEQLTKNRDKEVVKCFDLVHETFRKKRTGNKTLGITCAYCKYKEHCWSDVGEVRHLPQPASDAKFPKRFWYVGEVS